MGVTNDIKLIFKRWRRRRLGGRAGGKDLWEKFCKIETTRGLMSAVIYALHFSGETARRYIKERLQKSFSRALHPLA